MCVAGYVDADDVVADRVIECCRRRRLGVVEDDAPVLKILKMFQSLFQLLMLLKTSNDL